MTTTFRDSLSSVGWDLLNLYTTFEISMFTHYEDMKGNAKCRI